MKPHLTKTFKASNDPEFAEKLVDVVGLYLIAPDRALLASKVRGFYSLLQPGEIQSGTPN